MTSINGEFDLTAQAGHDARVRRGRINLRKLIRVFLRLLCTNPVCPSAGLETIMKKQTDINGSINLENQILLCDKIGVLPSFQHYDEEACVIIEPTQETA